MKAIIAYYEPATKLSPRCEIRFTGCDGGFFDKVSYMEITMAEDNSALYITPCTEKKKNSFALSLTSTGVKSFSCKLQICSYELVRRLSTWKGTYPSVMFSAKGVCIYKCGRDDSDKETVKPTETATKADENQTCCDSTETDIKSALNAVYGVPGNEKEKKVMNKLLNSWLFHELNDTHDYNKAAKLINVIKYINEEL